MDRCDFSSIMTCLKNHISESNQMNQPEFLYEVFEDFMDSPESKDFSFDNGLVCRWMTGQAKISPKISTYYAKPSKQEKLAETIHQNLLPLMTDCSKALQDVYTLFMQDATVSEAKKNKLELMVDISGEALERAGFSLEDLTPLKAIGVTGLRMDYHISNQQIADWSHQLKISLNASTITPKDIDELKEAEADFSQIEAWHNYYPRPETGLDKEWYQNSRSPCPRFCTRRYRVERPTISRIADFGRTSRGPSSCRRSRSISK